jgi:hypothetical protein
VLSGKSSSCVVVWCGDVSSDDQFFAFSLVNERQILSSPFGSKNAWPQHHNQDTRLKATKRELRTQSTPSNNPPPPSPPHS